MTLTAQIIVVGAGAAGLWAAAVAAERGADVLLLEKTQRTGSKVLASGGTRCNLTTTLGAGQAARLFGAGERFVLPALQTLPPHAVRKVFQGLGVPTIEEPLLEKVFPESQKALDVRDALVRRAKAAGVRLRTASPVMAVTPTAEGWSVSVSGQTLTCAKLMLCPGGRSYPATGTTGDGYRWLTALGLTLTLPVPALVPLVSPVSWVHALSGVSVQEAEARLLDPEGRVVGRRARPVLFTHQGLSGPGAMDLSAPVARAALQGKIEGWRLAIDLLPDEPQDVVRARLAEAARAPGAHRLARMVPPSVPDRVLEAVAKQAGLPELNPAISRVPSKLRNRLVDTLKGLQVPVTGTLGWEHAEVTDGGLELEEVERTTMEVKRLPGLYVFGELLDLTGPIGGLNFQAAFATAELAARAAVRA